MYCQTWATENVFNPKDDVIEGGGFNPNRRRGV